MKRAKAILIFVIVIVVALCVTIYVGLYNVAATHPDNVVISWILDTAMTRSVSFHAHGIVRPATATPDMTRTGFRLYHTLCVSCHGAPGVAPGEIARGLWPTAPDLVKSVDDWTPGQLFWIVKNGIKLTSMPAWGPTHSDEHIWALVAFMEKLPSLTPDAYKAMEQKEKGEPPGPLPSGSQSESPK